MSYHVTLYELSRDIARAGDECHQVHVQESGLLGSEPEFPRKHRPAHASYEHDPQGSV